MRSRNYRLFFGGQGISLIGTWMTRIAQAWLVYRLTGSAFLLGVIGFSGQIPTFLIGPFAGVWVDRLNRHRVLVVTQTLSMLQSFTLAALTLTHRITFWDILCLSLFQGVVNAVDMPGRQAFVVQMVENRSDLGNAIALNSSMVNAARLIGPSIAGLVIAASNEGVCFLIDGISYSAVIVSLLMMHIAPQIARSKTTEKRVLQDLREGWTYVSRFHPIRSMLILLAVVSLFGMPYTVLMPVFASQVLHGGPHTLGFLMGATGVGALLAAMRLAARRTVLGLGRMIPYAAGLFGIALMLFASSRVIWISLPLMLVAGYAMITQLASSNTILQTIVSDEKRGRVMSFYSMAFTGMAPFGSLLAGTVASRIGAPGMLRIGGGVCVLGGIWFSTQLKQIRELIHPIYRDLGILPEVAEGIQSAATLSTPPEG